MFMGDFEVVIEQDFDAVTVGPLGVEHDSQDLLGQIRIAGVTHILFKADEQGQS